MSNIRLVTDMFRSRVLTEQTAMTLVEILVSLVILGLVLMAIFPLMSQSLQVTNLSNTIAAQLFGGQEEIEVVAATKGGVLFADGTYLPDKYFPVLFGAEIPVPGMTIKKADLIRFLAPVPNIGINAGSRYEGYSTDEAKITIIGHNTNFIDTSKTKLKIVDKNDQDVTSYCTGYTVTDSSTASFILPTDHNRFTNLNSPYTITLTTGLEQVSCLLPIHLPRAIVIQANGNVLISSNAKQWISKNTASVIDQPVNKIAYFSRGEEDTRFIAVGNNGSIYAWLYGESWQKIDHGTTNRNLNSIIRTDDQFVVVGDHGTILTSPDGLNWTKESSPTNMDLNSVSYSSAHNSYISVGDGGIILTSADGRTWTKKHTYPRIAKGSINNKNAVEFSGDGDYLSTLTAPVICSTSRTIFMVVRPQSSPDSFTANLISWGSPFGTIDGGRFNIRTDANKLRVEQGSGIGFTSNLTIDNSAGNSPSLLVCRSTSAEFNSYELYLNGSVPQSPNIAGTINTASDFPAQLGSDSLSRYSSPMSYGGLIAEVLIFDAAVNNDRALFTDDTDPRRYASDFDLIQKYLSDKYNLGLSELNGEEMDNLIYPGSDQSLKNLTLDSFPSEVSRDSLVLWLDASELDLDNNQQVVEWLDLSGTNNHAAGASLLSVACSDSKIITGGYHRNMLLSSNTNDWSQNYTIGSKRTTEYSLTDIVHSNSQFVALFNDGLSSFTDSSTRNDRQNGLVGYSKDGVNWTLKSLPSSSNYKMNDMFCSLDGQIIMVVGNHGRIYTSEDDGINWVSATSGTTSDLYACCIR